MQSEVYNPSATLSAITENEFAAVSRLLYDVSGINLQSGKEGLVQSRLSKRLRALSLTSISEYLKRVKDDRIEMALMVDLLTTNKTSFFRESAHFDFLRQRILPGLAGSRRPIRIWSAACSTGEEPYCIAIVARETLTASSDSGVRVLATDISNRVLEQARNGIYGRDRVEVIPPQILQRHFMRVGEKGQAMYQVCPETRAMVSFAYLNLMEKWPMSGPFDVIFCRNVMIYFDRETQSRLIQRFGELLAPGGHLLIGHSETLGGANSAFRYIQPATYQKVQQ